MMKNLSKKAMALFIGISVVLPLLLFVLFKYYNNYVAALPFYAENYVKSQNETSFTVPDYEFINQDGKSINQNFTTGKVWVAHYFFTTCPTICPAMISGIRDVHENFSSNEMLKIVSFTVDPTTDTPEVLKNYAELHQINTNQWQLLTGDKKSLYRFARKGLYIEATDGDGGINDFIHSEKLVLIDHKNRIRGYYDGTESSDIKLLINHIQQLLNEIE